MMSNDVIVTEHLGRQFGSTHALSDVSLRVARGTVMALLGPNGSGKTTLLKLIRGLIQPTIASGRGIGCGF